METVAELLEYGFKYDVEFGFIPTGDESTVFIRGEISSEQFYLAQEELTHVEISVDFDIGPL